MPFGKLRKHYGDSWCISGLFGTVSDQDRGGLSPYLQFNGAMEQAMQGSGKSVSIALVFHCKQSYCI